MIPSVSRPGNPYDNASCESFMKTLKQEEIYANDCRDLEHVVQSVEAFSHRISDSIRRVFISKLCASVL
jgi:putative transposase